jgi:nucleoside-diphosphate-sugar epimerase
MAIDQTKTVVVTGANGLVGRALLKKLHQTQAYTIALTRSPVELPANRVVTGPLDAPPALAAIGGADCVVHLAGTFFPVGKSSYWTDNVVATGTVANALKDSKARRVLFLSYLGASESSKNQYLRTKAQAEHLLTATGKEAVIFRCTHIVGTPESPGPYALALIAKPGKKAGVLGNGRQIVTPLYLRDAVTALTLAMTGGSAGVYELAGPDRMALDDLVRLLNRNPDVPISHLPNGVAQIFGSILPMLPKPFVDVILQDSVGDSSRAKSMFGLKLTSLSSVWNKTI